MAAGQLGSRVRLGLERSAAFAVEVRSAVWTAGPA
eukprot:COSAG02_NODE_3582_length_6531_cov_4.696206_1_plen_34_part_10